MPKAPTFRQAGSVASAQTGLACALSAEFIEYRAVRAVIALARCDQAAQHVNDTPMCFHSGYDRLLMVLGQGANLAAWPLFIAYPPR